MNSRWIIVVLLGALTLVGVAVHACTGSSSGDGSAPSGDGSAPSGDSGPAPGDRTIQAEIIGGMS